MDASQVAVRRRAGQRIVSGGSTCSGKSSLARRLAPLIDAPVVELDALHWAPNWTEAPDDVMRRRVAAATAGDAWVVDGNYGQIRDLTWGQAETIVWLDYSLPVIYRRLLSRT